MVNFLRSMVILLAMPCSVLLSSQFLGENPSAILYASTTALTFSAYFLLDPDFIGKKTLSLWVKLIISFIIAFPCFFFLNQKQFLFALMAGIITFFYWPKNPLKNMIPPIRNIPLLKTSAVALSFTLISTALPFPDHIDLIHIAQRFLFFLAITFPFEIRDAEADYGNARNLTSYLDNRSILLISALFFLASSVLVNFAPGKLDPTAQTISYLIPTILLPFIAYNPKKNWLYIALDSTIIFQLLFFAV